MLKIKTTSLLVFILMALLCFAACTPRQTSIEQVPPNSQSTSFDKQEDKQQSDTKIFLGEEYVKRNDIALPKHILKNIPTGPIQACYAYAGGI